MSIKKNSIDFENTLSRSIFDKADAVFCVIDSTGTMTQMNEFAEQFTGYTAAEISSEPYFWKCLLPVEVQDKVMGVIIEAKKGNIVKHNQSVWISREGEERMFEWSNTLVKKNDGSMDYLFSIGIDITETFNAKQNYELIFNTSKDGIAITDFESNLLDFNDAYLEMTGFTRQELLQKSCLELTAPEGISQFEEVMQEVFEKGFVKDFEKSFIAKDNHLLQTNISIAMMPDKKRILLNVKNISSMLHIRQELEESFDRYDKALAATQDGIWEWIVPSGEGYFSPSWKLMLGYQDDELENTFAVWEKLLYPEDFEYARNEAFKLASGEIDNYEIEVRMICKDGSIKWILSRAKVMEKDDQGNPLRIFGTHVDIQKQKELLQEKNTLLSLFDKGDSVLFKWKNDEEWSVEYVSQNVGGLLGYTHDEFINHEVAYAHSIYEKDLPHVLEEVTTAINTNADFFKHDPYRVITKNGEMHWVLDYTVTQKDVNGNITHFIGYITDITDIKEKEHKLLELVTEVQEKEQILKDYIDSSTDFVWEVDLDGKYTYVSEGTKDILGYESDELIGKTPFDFMSEAEAQRVSQDFINIIQNRLNIDDLENWNISKSGEPVCLLTNGVPIFNASGDLLGYRGTDKDITESKQIKEELVKAKEVADRANEAKSAFLANMSHEIRTPMNAILGFVEQLKKHETDPERQKSHNIIESSGMTLMSIINDILDYSKIESGKITLEEYPYSVIEFAEEIHSMFKQIMTEKKILFKHSFASNVPESVLGDNVRLKQVITNLLSNAAKFTSEHGTISFEIAFDEKQARLFFSVTDSGIGIAEENISKIFNAFDQEDSSTTRKFGGTGLGLSISSKLVDLMDGKLKVESVQGRGSRFYFSIPVKISIVDKSVELATPNPALSTETSEQVHDGHLLVVEDNKTNQILMSMILDDFGVTYDIANDGVEAVEAVKTKKYDLILMDENMPNMNGIEATNQIRSLEKEKQLTPLPIIVVTANAMNNDKQRFLDAGMDDYISKPYTESDINLTLKKYLR